MSVYFYSILLVILVLYQVKSSYRENDVVICTFIFLDFRPVNTVLYSTDPIVKLNKMFNITCSAEAKPLAKYSFYDGGRIISARNMSGNTYTAVVKNRIKKVIYGCLPRNEFGNGSFKEVELSVYCK